MKRVYLIGAGFIAREHAKAVLKAIPSGEVQLSVADPIEESLASFAHQFPGTRTFTTPEAMLQEAPQEDDVVVVATPPVTHCNLAIMALKSGRHVLCEKPFAMNVREAEAMVAAAREVSRSIGCCSVRFVGTPTTNRVKEILEEGTLGQVYHMTFISRTRRGRAGVEYQPNSRWFLDKSKSGGGILLDWGPYDIGLLIDLFHPIRVDVLSGWTANPRTGVALPEGTVFDVEMHAGADLRLHQQDGTQISVTYERASCTHGEERSILEIEGVDGAVSWDWLCYSGSGHVTVSTDVDGEVTTHAAVYPDETGIGPHERPVTYFLDYLARGDGHPSLALVGDHALFHYRCVDAIYKAAETGEPQTVSIS